MNIVRKSAGTAEQQHARGARPGPALALGIMASVTALPALADSWIDDTYVTPMLSYAIADDDRHSDDALGGTLALGWRLSERLEVEVRGQYLKFKADDDTYPCGLLNLDTCAYESKKVAGGGFGANAFLTDNGGPYLHADVMATDDRPAYHAGLGWDFRFSESGWALRAEALLQTDSQWDYKEPLFNLGLRIPLGAHRTPKLPEPIPEPVRVVEPVTPPPPPPPPCEMPADGSAIDLSGCKTGDKVVLRGVNFEFDKWNLTVNAKTLLDGVVTALQQRPDITVEVAGHTDGKGSDSYNQKLSERRAASVMKYLVDKGIDKSRITATGYGESQPIATNETDEGRELNRRVEMKVLSADPNAGGVSVAPIDPSAPVEPAPAAAPAAPAPATSSTAIADMLAADAAGTPAPVAPAPAAETDPAPAAVAATPTVAIVDMAFTPATLTVPVGTTVTFTNNDGSNHIVAFADGQRSPRLPMGKSYTRTFTAPGTYTYACTIHPHMTGTITVQ